MKRIFILVASVILLNLSASAVYRYVGGDISLLPEYEKAGAKYYSHTGSPISDLVPWLHEQGMNAMRVRLFVNPSDYKGDDKDPNACQDLNYIIPLCKRIKDSGMALLLDFHYSDTWADPAKQWTPAAWAGLTDIQLYQKIYDYTRESLNTLKDNGIIPDFIQTGNEISYGMLWGTVGTPSSQLKKVYSSSEDNWGRFCRLLSQAIKACNEVCPDAKIVLHSERVAQPSELKHFYSQMAKYAVNYDIIGLSYYPYFHGNMSVLDTALASLQSNFPSKNIMIVETGYSYKWEVPGTSQKVDYAYSDAGQNKFATELVETLLKYDKVDGLFWWWLEYNAYKTTLSGWYNAPLFDSTNGRATSALKTICSFADGNSAVSVIESDPSQHTPTLWYDMRGIPVASPQKTGLYINNKGEKIIL